jgi:Sec-independent protein translocase protein TatA
MFDFSIGKLMVIFAVALLVLGPEKAKELAFNLGIWIKRIKEIKNDLQHKYLHENEFKNVITEVKKDISEIKSLENELQNEINEISHELHDECNPYALNIDNLNIREIKRKKRKVSTIKSSRVGKFSKRMKK